MQTSRIYLDDNSISGRLRSSWPVRQDPELNRRRIVMSRGNYSGMIGQEVVAIKPQQPARPIDNHTFSRPLSDIQATVAANAATATTATAVRNTAYQARSVVSEVVTPVAVASNDIVASSVRAIKSEYSSSVTSTTSAKATESVLARQFDIEEHSTSSSKKGRRLAARLRNFTSRATTVLAAVVFLAGAYVVFDGYRTNRQIKTQVQQVSAAVDNGGATTSEGLPSETPPSDSIENYKVAADMPRFLEISSLGVKSRVVRMGVTPDGAVQAPSNIYDSGWYDGSAKPGQPGAAFIDGHVSGYTQPGVFKQIKNLKQNDTMKVEMGDGTQYSYKVVKVESYPADSVDMTKVLAPVTVGKQGLNIMTCGGSFDNSTHQYKERVVVFTERI